MDCKNVKVTTESGFVCLFYEEDDGTPMVACFNKGAFFNNEVVAGSIGELKEGKLLKFCYYAGLSSEKFVSSSPITSIDKIKEI